MNAKQESERLMNSLLPLAETMLRQYGEFYPYGGYMKPDGTIVDVGAEDRDAEHPKSKDLIYVLQRSFQEMARAAKCKAVAIFFDVVVNSPNSGIKSNAIQVCLDHEDGYSAEVFFPYRLANNEILYDEAFAQQGEEAIFGQT